MKSCSGGSLFLLLFLVPVSLTYAFEFPTFESLSSLFGSTEHKATEDEVLERYKRQGSGDSCSEPFLACSATLPRDRTAPKDENDKYPINFREMPTLANGHVGFIPYSPILYMNGVYNGRGGDSHRAAIPNLIMGKVEMASPELELRLVQDRKFTFDARKGVFSETINTDFARITHRMYAHQRFTKLFVSDIHIEAVTNTQSSRGGGTIRLVNFPDWDISPDFNFKEPSNPDANWKMEGTTLDAEDGANRQTIHMFYTKPISEISIRGASKREVLLLAVDRQHSAAQNEFQAALDMLFQQDGADRLLQQHVDHWEDTWQAGSIEVIGDIRLAKLTNFAQYYLLSNLPSLDPYQEPQRSEFHFGVSRSSLGHGGKGKNHQGHVMWDSEMYVLPAVLPFHPRLAKKMLRYRTALADAAKENARARGEKGLWYPWESAYTGADVTPEDTCTRCADQQIHVSGAVAFAIRQYYSLTRDRDFITNTDYAACDVMKDIAEFYGERAKYKNKDGRYHIDNVMGPDDYHPNVDNNAYTNVLASLAIHYARYINCMCNRNARKEVPDDYIQVALYLDLPFNNEKRLHYAFDGFKNSNNKTIKQADTLLLAYPLNWNMSRDIVKNDLEYYENLITDLTPAMTYSFMTVGWKFAEDYPRMDSYFTKSYENYYIQPFKVWTEYNEGSPEERERSTVNFLPGMGAFLQSLVYGFAGVRIRPEQLEFHNPMPPTGALELVLKEFDYMGASFTVTIYESQRIEVEVHQIGDYELVLQRNSSRGGRESLFPGTLVTIQDGRRGFYIYSTEGTPCEHPHDYVYMPWGYSPWINAAPLDSSRPAALLCTFIVAILLTSL